MTMTKGYDPEPERKYTASEAPRIVEPEPMLPEWIKHPPKWIKYSVSCLVVIYLGLNFSGFVVASEFKSRGMSKSEIEEKVDENYRDRNGLVRFVMDDLSKPGRELAYLICEGGEK